MPLIADAAFDAALNYIKNGLDGTGGQLNICDNGQPEPTTLAQARTTYTLGNEAINGTGNTTGPQAGDTDGRELQINAITDGDITATNTAGYWALSNSTVLLAVGSLSATQAVTSGNKFTLAAFDITIRDATNV